METKVFCNKKIIIREISKKDLNNVKKFQDFINSLIEENAKILVNKKVTQKKEKSWLIDVLKKKNNMHLIAEHDNKIVASTNIEMLRWRSNHVGNFGISVKQGYRGIGLGKYLTQKIIILAKKRLGIKIVKLEVFTSNKPAIALYKKTGFKRVARIPKQIQYKNKLVDEYVMLLYL